MHIVSPSRCRLTTPIIGQPIGKAIIAQNKGGGHGELGYHLALKLIEKDISVTLLQDGAGKNKDKQPFARCASCALPVRVILEPRNNTSQECARGC